MNLSDIDWILSELKGCSPSIVVDTADALFLSRKNLLSTPYASSGMSVFFLYFIRLCH